MSTRMIETKNYTDHQNPRKAASDALRKTHGKKPKRIIYEQNEREAFEEIEEYKAQKSTEELPDMREEPPRGILG